MAAAQTCGTYPLDKQASCLSNQASLTGWPDCFICCSYGAIQQSLHLLQPVMASNWLNSSSTAVDCYHRADRLKQSRESSIVFTAAGPACCNGLHRLFQTDCGQSHAQPDCFNQTRGVDCGNRRNNRPKQSAAPHNRMETIDRPDCWLVDCYNPIETKLPIFPTSCCVALSIWSRCLRFLR